MALLVACASALARDARTQVAEPGVAAKMTCERIEQPGRIKCEVEARTDAALSMKWGDVEIVAVPPFVTPLKGRIGPADATTREPDLWKWALALAAREKGAGDVQARVRLVVCKPPKSGEAESCMPRATTVTARVRVGD